MPASHFSQALQENLLTLLCFSGDYCHAVAHAVTPDRFDGIYQEIARKVVHYVQEQKIPPGVGHLPDLIEDELDSDRGEQYKRVLFNLVENREAVNAKYTMSRLSQFLLTQQLREGIIEAANCIQTDTESSADQTLDILTKLSRARSVSYSAGTFLGHPEALNALFEEEEVFPTGIECLDQYGLGPARKELHLFLGMVNRGKSWWLMHLGRQAIMQRKRVCHITLEMSEQKVVRRYYQSLFAVPKRKEPSLITEFELDDLGRITNLDRVEIHPRLSFDSPTITKDLLKLQTHWRPKLDQLVVKEFPTGRLTEGELIAYLDMLESVHRFVPDLLLIDYADLMKVDAKNYRLDIGRIYKGLRGIGVERNMAVATVSQSNRTGGSVKRVGEMNVGEDFSKLQTSDVGISYSQTEHEERLGLARLFVLKARNDLARTNILISQNYALGQFHLRSTWVVKRYWELMKNPGEAEPEDEEPRKGKSKKKKGRGDRPALILSEDE